MRNKPRFRPLDGSADGTIRLVINPRMRAVLARLLCGLPDDLITALAGPVASSVKAFGETLASRSVGPGGVVVTT